MNSLKVFKKKESRGELLQLQPLLNKVNKHKDNSNSEIFLLGQKPAAVPKTDSSIRDAFDESNGRCPWNGNGNRPGSI